MAIGNAHAPRKVSSSENSASVVRGKEIILSITHALYEARIVNIRGSRQGQRVRERRQCAETERESCKQESGEHDGVRESAQGAVCVSMALSFIHNPHLTFRAHVSATENMVMDTWLMTLVKSRLRRRGR